MESWPFPDRLRKFDALNDATGDPGVTPEFLAALESATPALTEAFSRFLEWIQEPEQLPRTAVATAGRKPGNIFQKAMTPDEVAHILRLSRLTVVRKARLGIIPSFRVGNQVRFDPKVFAVWLKKHGLQ